MNEYCLLDIFSEKSIDLMDLCALAETCRLFRRITQRIAPKKLQIDQPYGSDGYVVEKTERTLEDVVRIFKSFGSNFSELQLEKTATMKNCKSFNRDVRFQEECFVLDLVTSYCDQADNLKSLMIERFIISDAFTIKLKPIFKQLQKLHLHFVNIMDDATLFAELDELVELVVHGVKNCCVILENSFPKLERFAYYTFNEKSQEMLSTFISCHKSLKTLELQLEASEAIMQVIVDCRDLNELNISVGNRNDVDLRPLQSLRSLRALKLFGPLKFVDFEFFSVLRNLSELHLVLCNLPKDSIEFCKLRQLTKLHLTGYYINMFYVVDIIRRLVNLKELNISCLGSFLDETTFTKIFGIVEGRPNVLTIICRSNFKVNENCDKKRNVILLPPFRYGNKFVFL